MGGRVHSPTLVGSVEELQPLEAALNRAADADPAVVLVGGEAGVGKTRLIAELASRHATDGTRMLVGGCVPVGDGALPYAPIVEVLRDLLGEVGVEAVRELVGPAWPELARLLPTLGEPDRRGPPGQAAQARLFELLLGLLGRLSDQAPLVLVLEDLHWADRSTRQLLAFLIRNLRRERILVIVTYRNDEPSHQREPVDEAAMPSASSLAASLGLTQREAEVLALVAQGRTNRQIGQVLFITPKTAGVHVSRILAKLGVAGRGEAAAVAHRLGLDKQ